VNSGLAGFTWRVVSWPFFFFEMLLRIYIAGLRTHCFGADWCWNLFDALILLISVVDLVISTLILSSGDTSLTILRVIRLSRLSRMMRMFRFSFLKELTLMIKGLLGGIRTLLWATVLLVFTIYVIAVFATAFLGSSTNVHSTVDTEKLFQSVPRSMFTAFRCFTGDCSDDAGRNIPMSLAEAYGTPFVLAYVLCVMLVVFGIFNLIVAIYIEHTLEAAKVHHELDKRMRERESLRVAHATKDLLKKFCAGLRLFSDTDGRTPLQAGDLIKSLRKSSLDEVEDLHMTISKDLFLLVIQDPEVQALMDALDIPPDRASLFDVLDADGSGGLQVTELVHGLLKVRGEARKSDIVAVLLSIRALQDMMRSVPLDNHVQHQDREDVLQPAGQSTIHIS